MNAPVLSVRNLTKQFHSKPPTMALDAVTFDLCDGEILGFLGPNGAGKTTTIRMLISILKPTAGEISFFGKDLVRHRSEILQHVGYASTYTSLPYYLTVEENLDIHGRIFGISRNDRRERMKKFLSFFNVEMMRKRRMSQLSAGQRTRIMMVKAFLSYPKIALLDEPTASLDPDVSHEVRAFISEQRRQHGVSVLLTSHNMDEVTSLCDRVIFVKQGKILATDTPRNLAASISDSRIHLTVTGDAAPVAAYLAAQKLAYHNSEQTFSIDVAHKDTAPLIQALSRLNIEFTNLSIEQPTLEDFFLQVARR